MVRGIICGEMLSSRELTKAYHTDMAIFKLNISGGEKISHVDIQGKGGLGMGKCKFKGSKLDYVWRETRKAMWLDQSG